MKRLAALLLALAPLGSLTLTGCHATTPAPAPDAGEDAGPAGFIALDRDFAGYRGWTSFDDTGDGGIPKRVYVNALPGPGAHAFPEGTVIVKETDAGAGADPELDAMAKRGADYNPTAPGWEFFGLARTDGGDLLISWRGTGDWHTGGGYGNSGKSCAACHGEDTANDSVQSPALQLH